MTSQPILLIGKCGLALGSPSLATLTAAGGMGSMGLGPDSIGVFDGPRGVACYRITASLDESVTFGLGSYTTASIDANAFYRLELDIEVKQNAAFLLEILNDSVVVDRFYMRSGSSIIAGEGSFLPGSLDHIFNCSAESDSGPDAGLRDNCRWIVDALGEEFRLIPLVGEGSWEGGGDFGTGVAAYDNNSLIYLTKAAIGALGCRNTLVPQSTTTPTIGIGTNGAQCTITRIDPTNVGGSCTTAIGYVLRGVAKGCEMLKAPGEQLAASADILFPPEPRTDLGAEPLTTIVFSNPLGGTVDFIPERCTGTVVDDSNGERTILEVLRVSPPIVGYDVVPGGDKDWACVLDNEQKLPVYIGADQMQIRQTILFWGDIEIRRQ